ncbi:Zinc-iron permease, partial [Globisporangium splendens]
MARCWLYHTVALTALWLYVACVIPSNHFVSAQEDVECSGHGKVHGSHCHCLPGYKNKGLECLPADGATCAAGGITWEASSLLFLEKGTYTIELVNNTESMATFVLPLLNLTEPTAVQLEESVELANQLLEDVTLARRSVKNGGVMAPTTKLLYVIVRNNIEELQRLQAECEATAGNIWHIDHCDGPDGHSRRLGRQLADQVLAAVNLTIDAPGHFALHMQHNAVEEFAMRIIDHQGVTVDPLVFLGSDESESSETTKATRTASGSIWIKTMGAVAVVTIISVIGIFFLLVKASLLEKLMDAFVALSAGALFGTAILHILPESIEFHSEYGQMNLTICTVFIAGFMIAMIVEMLLELSIGNFSDDGVEVHHHHQLPASGEKEMTKMLSPSTPSQQDRTSHQPFTDASATEMETVGQDSAPQSPWSLEVEWTKIKPVAYIILIGDLFHNFVDGVLIATAFLACDDALGIAVAASAILHEAPQEIADFVVLTDAGFTKFQAVTFNFISALSSFLGATIILSSITVTNETMGLLLGFGAGTLVYISATDLLPRVLRVRTIVDFFMRIFLFAVGVGMLALTTLYHVHCDADA